MLFSWGICGFIARLFRGIEAWLARGAGHRIHQNYKAPNWGCPYVAVRFWINSAGTISIHDPGSNAQRNGPIRPDFLGQK